jgi:NAD(P)-dependent dehydrogenase (short-subunit alcohol dehydrogenase family)
VAQAVLVGLAMAAVGRVGGLGAARRAASRAATSWCAAGAGAARQALVARNHDFLRDLAAEVAGTGGRAVPVPADVSKADQVQAAFQRVRAELGPPHVLIYNAVGCRAAPAPR